MGTLGLAWTGDLKNAGGVCEKNGVSLKHVSKRSVDLKSNEIPSTFLLHLKKKKKTPLSKTCETNSWKCDTRFNFAALSRQHEVAEHRNSDFTELREARTARRFSRHIGARDRP